MISDIGAKPANFKDGRLAQAIAATFRAAKDRNPNRTTRRAYISLRSDPTKQQQWNGFVEEVAVNPGPLVDVVGGSCSLSSAACREG